MKQHKLILFDWGNIVESHTTGYSCHKAWDELFKACGYKGEEGVFRKLTDSKLTAISTISDFKKMFEIERDKFGLTTTFDEFVENYDKCFENIEYYEDVRDYEISLKDKCYIGILSNLTIFDKKRLDKQVGLNNYDYVFLSFEMGLRKPDIEIYEKVQSNLPFEKEDILFVDDNINNINTAKEFGWNTVHATGLELEKIKEECQKFLGENI